MAMSLMIRPGLGSTAAGSSLSDCERMVGMVAGAEMSTGCSSEDTSDRSFSTLGCTGKDPQAPRSANGPDCMAMEPSFAGFGPS